MKSLKLQTSAVWGMLVAGVVYTILSVLPLLHPDPKVPVVKKSLAAGSYVSRGDVNWVPLTSSQAKNWHPGYLRLGVSKGQTLLSGLLVRHKLSAAKGVLVAIPEATAVAHVGQKVHVLVIPSSGHIWASGPVSVVSTPSPSGLTGSGGPLIVAMSWTQAMTFERLSIHGRVSLVGIRS